MTMVVMMMMMMMMMVMMMMMMMMMTVENMKKMPTSNCVESSFFHHHPLSFFSFFSFLLCLQVIYSEHLCLLLHECGLDQPPLLQTRRLLPLYCVVVDVSSLCFFEKEAGEETVHVL